MKCVQFLPNDSNIFASVGNGNTLRIWDQRQKKSTQKIFLTHRGVPNSLCWHPSDPNVLLTAAFGINYSPSQF